jgi:hypothetical protein
MTFRLSRVLRVVCYLLAASGMFFMAMPFIDVALHRYDSVASFFAGVFVFAFAIPFFLLSRSSVATHPESRPILAGVLWTLAAVFGLVAVRLLYFGIRSYV